MLRAYEFSQNHPPVHTLSCSGKGIIGFGFTPPSHATRTSKASAVMVPQLRQRDGRRTQWFEPSLSQQQKCSHDALGKAGWTLLTQACCRYKARCWVRMYVHSRRNVTLRDQPARASEQRARNMPRCGGQHGIGTIW